MKGLYIANHNLNDESSGVTKKIKMQLSAFKKHRIEIDAPDLFVDTKIDKIIRRIPLAKSGFNKKTENMIEYNLDNYDFVYIRHPLCDLFFFRTIKKIKSKNVQIIYEFPTFPYDRNSNGIKWKLSLLKDKLFRGRLFKYVDCAVNYSGYKSIFSIKALPINNGIDPDCYEPRCIKEHKGRIVLLGVALLTYWNGYDRIIKAIKNYKGLFQIEFHIAGEGDELHNLKRLTRELGIEDKVIFHGFISGNELDELYDICDFGIGTLSPSRKYKNHVMSTLKTKEYCAKGIPFIKGDYDEVIDKEKPDFVFNVPDDDTDIDLASILKWYEELISHYPGDRITEHIRNFCCDYLTWEKQLEPVFKQIVLKGKIV